MKTFEEVHPATFAFKTGDIIAVRKRDFIHNVIAWFQRGRGESEPRVTHCGVIAEGGAYWDAMIVESWMRVLYWKFIRAYPLDWPGVCTC